MVTVSRHIFKNNSFRSGGLQVTLSIPGSLKWRIRNMASSSKTSSLTPFSPTAHPEVKIPKFIYGTAWKKDKTADLVYQAIKAGFRAIDTAAQPRHYQEALVGKGIKRAIDEGIVKRDELHVSLSLYHKKVYQNLMHSIDPNKIHITLRSRSQQHALRCLSTSRKANFRLHNLIPIQPNLLPHRRTLHRHPPPPFPIKNSSSHPRSTNSPLNIRPHSNPQFGSIKHIFPPHPPTPRAAESYPTNLCPK